MNEWTRRKYISPTHSNWQIIPKKKIIHLENLINNNFYSIIVQKILIFSFPGRRCLARYIRKYCGLCYRDNGVFTGSWIFARHLSNFYLARFCKLCLIAINGNARILGMYVDRFLCINSTRWIKSIHPRWMEMCAWLSSVNE